MFCTRPDAESFAPAYPICSSLYKKAAAELGSIGALYNLTMDPFEKYDMIFNGAQAMRELSSSPGKYAGQDNGWIGGHVAPALLAFDQSLIKFPNINASLEALRRT